MHENLIGKRVDVIKIVSGIGGGKIKDQLKAEIVSVNDFVITVVYIKKGIKTYRESFNTANFAEGRVRIELIDGGNIFYNSKIQQWEVK